MLPAELLRSGVSRGKSTRPWSRTLWTVLAWCWLCSPMLWAWPGSRSLASTLGSALLLSPVFLHRDAGRLAALVLLLVGTVWLGYFWALRSPPDEYFWFTLFNTNPREATEYLGSIRAGDLLLTMGWLLPACLAVHWLWFTAPSVRRRSIQTGFVAILLLWPAWFGMSAYKGDSLEGALRKINRIYPVAMAEALLRNRAALASVFVVPEVAPPPRPARADVIVVVLGESASAARWSLLGYRGNNTNGALEPLQAGLDVLPVLSNGNNTAQTIPVLLSGRPFAATAASYGLATYLDRARGAGFQVLSMSNQEAASSGETFFQVAFRSRSDDFRQMPPGQWDGALTEPLEQALDRARTRAAPLLITLHTIGSHPNLARRYPPEAAHWADPYDNSIAYSSHLLAQWATALERSASGRAVLLYISDHGLNLPDCGGTYTHGSARSAFEVPMLIWTNTAFREAQPDWAARLAQNARAAPDGFPMYDNRVFQATVADLLGYFEPDYPSLASRRLPPRPMLHGQPYRELALANSCRVDP